MGRSPRAGQVHPTCSTCTSRIRKQMQSFSKGDRPTSVVSTSRHVAPLRCPPLLTLPHTKNDSLPPPLVPTYLQYKCQQLKEREMKSKSLFASLVVSLFVCLFKPNANALTKGPTSRPTPPPRIRRRRRRPRINCSTAQKVRVRWKYLKLLLLLFLLTPSSWSLGDFAIVLSCHSTARPPPRESTKLLLLLLRDVTKAHHHHPARRRFVGGARL